MRIKRKKKEISKKKQTNMQRQINMKNAQQKGK